MRVLILSDLHDDFWAESRRDPFAGLEEVMGEIDQLVLAGDISNKPTVRWKYAFERLSKLISLDKIAVFPGNHDFYDFVIDGEDRLSEIARSFDVSYVQKGELLFGSSRLLCATLWTDFELGRGSVINKDIIAARMNDYRKIRVASHGYRKLWPSDVLAHHRDHRAWLEAKLSIPFSGQTLVATHHAPHPGVLNNYSDNLDAAYASDLEKMMCKFEPAAWFFGHCHDAKNIQLGNTRLVNVALGYPDEVEEPAKRLQNSIFDL